MKRRNFLKAALAASLLPLLPYIPIKVIKPVWTKKYLWQVPNTIFSIPAATTHASFPKSLKRVYLTMVDKARFVDLDNPESVNEAENLFDLSIFVTDGKSNQGFATTFNRDSDGVTTLVESNFLYPKKGMQLVLAKDSSA